LIKEAVLLAAGKGLGLEPLTTTRNKVLMPALNKPILIHHIEHLRTAGIKRVVIVVKYLKEQVIRVVENILSNEDLGIDVAFIDQGDTLGTGHALASAISEIRSNRFVLIYGDVFTELNDLIKVVNYEGNYLVVLAKVKNPRRYGVAVVSNDGKLVRIIEKPEVPPSNLVNAGIYVLSEGISKYLRSIELSSRGELELTDAINLLAKEERVSTTVLNTWFDIGRPWSLLELNKYLLSKVTKQVIKGNVEPNVVIKGPVIIEEGAEVLSGTYIKGPVYIGRSVVVGPNAYLRPYSVLLNNSRVGFNVEVKESIVMEGVHASHQSYIGDSIIGEESNLGAGTILANLRFDNRNVKVTIKGVREDSGRRKLGGILGAYVKTGVNVSICPGVKVGAYTWIYPGVTVCRDVPQCVKVVRNDFYEPLSKCLEYVSH